MMAAGCAPASGAGSNVATIATPGPGASDAATPTTSVVVVPETAASSSTQPSTQPSVAARAAGSTEPVVVVRTPSLPAWSPPTDALALPAPDGPAAVGIASSGFPDTVVFYPAVAGTGHGPHRYVEPGWATAAGLDPAQMDRVVSTAEIDATPAATDAPRPVVLLTPGWRSVVAFSTSLAEDLASHGYVVLASQTDVVAEWSHPSSTAEDRKKRISLLAGVLDFLQGPSLPALVGPIDLHRIAVGGHSYAATIAFDAALTDRRIAAMFDLDGSARGAGSRTPPTRPSLVLVTINGATVSDPLLGGLSARSPQIVAVGLLDAKHLDVTDAASIPSLLGTSVFSTLVGGVGSAGTTDTSTVVVRFLDATLGPNRHRPSSGELVSGLPSATPDPFGSQTPASR